MICPSELKHGIIHSQTTVAVVVDWLVKPRDLSAIWRTSQYWCSLLHPIPLLSFIFSFDLAIGIVVLLQKNPICHGINTPKKKYAAYSALFFIVCAASSVFHTSRKRFSLVDPKLFLTIFAMCYLNFIRKLRPVWNCFIIIDHGPA